MISKKTLSSKISLILLFALMLFLGNLKFKQVQGQKEIERQKSSLQKQADSLQKQNDELNQSLQYLNSPDSKEKVARQQLNYKKQGEIVFGFADTNISQTAPAQDTKNTGNFKKWWNYFFEN